MHAIKSADNSVSTDLVVEGARGRGRSRKTWGKDIIKIYDGDDVECWAGLI